MVVTEVVTVVTGTVPLTLNKFKQFPCSFKYLQASSFNNRYLQVSPFNYKYLQVSLYNRFRRNGTVRTVPLVPEDDR